MKALRLLIVIPWGVLVGMIGLAVGTLSNGWTGDLVDISIAVALLCLLLAFVAIAIRLSVELWDATKD
jgi:hypothetical protein